MTRPCRTAEDVTSQLPESPDAGRVNQMTQREARVAYHDGSATGPRVCPALPPLWRAGVGATQLQRDYPKNEN